MENCRIRSWSACILYLDSRISKSVDKTILVSAILLVNTYRVSEAPSKFNKYYRERKYLFIWMLNRWVKVVIFTTSHVWYGNLTLSGGRHHLVHRCHESCLSTTNIHCHILCAADVVYEMEGGVASGEKVAWWRSPKSTPANYSLKSVPLG